MKYQKSPQFSFLILLEDVEMGFPNGSDGKEPTCNTGDPGSIPGLGRCPGEGNDNPLWYSFLENPMDRGTWGAIVHGLTELDTTE